jgi:hypothetical protein
MLIKKFATGGKGGEGEHRMSLHPHTPNLRAKGYLYPVYPDRETQS